MPHVDLPDLPGIRALFVAYPETGRVLSELAQVLLHEPRALSRADRELIATHVSYLNDCLYCQSSHQAIATHHLDGDAALAERVKVDPENAPIPEKLKALIAIAAQVQRGGKHVRPEHVLRARNAGASDQEIHDAVLIAAVFCMYNRYVDGLATMAPSDPNGYLERAEPVAKHGYVWNLQRVLGSAASGKE
ncbi:MAG: peroxidase-related enzyme [Bryobacteraceae bacterium]|nr:peroxidase-related enzyme [Bryobacteraceae bacterium]